MHLHSCLPGCAPSLVGLCSSGLCGGYSVTRFTGSALIGSPNDLVVQDALIVVLDYFYSSATPMSAMHQHCVEAHRSSQEIISWRETISLFKRMK
jgi:hypothetical protein